RTTRGQRSPTQTLQEHPRHRVTTGRLAPMLQQLPPAQTQPIARIGNAQLFHDDCFAWLERQPPASIQAVVTDPPYGLVEYSQKEQRKLRRGTGGVWRIPPSFDGHKRSPLPRFTVLDDRDKAALFDFFKRLAVLLGRVTVPGANILVAGNPLL